MELTTRGRYAVMAMADLAANASDRAVPLPSIAERQRISLAYLEQIFVHLRRAGLVESTRGRTGGYLLAKSAEEINIAQIMAAVEEGTQMTRCLADANISCQGLPGRCQTHPLWRALSNQIRQFLERITLADVLEDNSEDGDRIAWLALRDPAAAGDAPPQSQS